MSGLAASCRPDDDDHHPRYRGLRTWGRWAAYETAAVGVVVGAWVLLDLAWGKVSGRT